jgi:hypothetical protein
MHMGLLWRRLLSLPNGAARSVRAIVKVERAAVAALLKRQVRRRPIAFRPPLPIAPALPLLAV